MKNMPTSYKLISSHAEFFTQYANNGETPININKIIRLRPDIRINLEKLPKGVRYKGYNRQALDGKWDIFIDEDLPYQEQRIVFGHELCHILFNQPMEDSRDSSLRPGDIKSMKEHAAEQFAEALMMPTKLFKKYWKKYNHDVDLLAQIFQVPLAAIENRILTLELV